MGCRDGLLAILKATDLVPQLVSKKTNMFVAVFRLDVDKDRIGTQATGS